MDENEEINPFLINMVMKTMTSQMSLQELKKFRQVCHFWDQMLLEEISSKKIIQISLSTMKKAEIRKFVYTTCVNSHLYHNFRISSLQGNLLDKVQFFEIFGKITKLHLDIRLGAYFKEEFFVHKEIVKILGKISSTIQNLSLKLQPDDWGNETEWAVYKFEDFLTFPQLTKLKLDMYYNPVLDLGIWISQSDCPKLAQISITSVPEAYKPVEIGKFTKFIQNVQLKNIKNLQVNTWMDKSNLEILRDINDCTFSLMKLRLMVDKFDDLIEATQTLNLFLKAQSSSLIDLDLLIVLVDTGNYHDEDFHITHLVKLPRMPFLKKCKISAPGISFEKFDFQNVFPNLESFEMDDLPGLIEVTSSEFPQKNLKWVKLDDRSNPGILGEFKLDQICGWWPEVREIILPVHFLKKSFGEEISGLEKLKKMVIHMDPNWDVWFKPKLSQLKSLKILELGSNDYDLHVSPEKICEEFYLAFEKTIRELSLSKFILKRIEISERVAEKFRALIPNGFEYCF